MGKIPFFNRSTAVKLGRRGLFSRIKGLIEGRDWLRRTPKHEAADTAAIMPRMTKREIRRLTQKLLKEIKNEQS